MTNTVVISKAFHDRLTNRNELQGDGKFNAVKFREKFLADLDTKDAWLNDDTHITLDFTGVIKVGPSFANEVFAYFTKYAAPKRILKKINIINATKVQKAIIEMEVETGHDELI